MFHDFQLERLHDFMTSGKWFRPAVNSDPGVPSTEQGLFSVLTSWIVNLIFLLLPAFAIVPHCFGEQIRQALPASILGVAIGKTVSLLDKATYVTLLGTTAGLAVTFRVVFKNRTFGRLLLPAVVLLTVAILLAAKTGDIGSDSVGEIARTNWHEAFDYCWQSLQTLSIQGRELIFGALLFVFFSMVCVAAKQSIYRPSPSIAITTIAICLGSCVGLCSWSIFDLVKNRSSFNTYSEHLQTATAQASRDFGKRAGMPNILVYIGESTDRDWLYPELKKQLQDQPSRDNAVFFSDVVSSHSHTFLSLFRALSISQDPARDQLTRDQFLFRPNLVSVLGNAGIITKWYSTQIGDDWTGTLFGGQTAAAVLAGREQARQPVNDGDLLQRTLQEISGPKAANKTVFFHSYAGHADYCENIPRNWTASSNRMPDLPFVAIFGELPVVSKQRHLRQLQCYGRAMNYVAANLASAIRTISASPDPAVLIYFSDHGEDVFEGTDHDSGAGSWRKIEVPLVIFFNDAAKTAYPDQFRTASENSDQRYSLEWLGDSIADLAGLDYRRRPWKSLFSKGTAGSTPNRYSSLRDYRGREWAIAVDGSTEMAGVQETPIDLYIKRRLIQSFEADQQRKICAHRADSVLKFSDASRVFACQEIDLVIEPAMNEVYVFHPPRKNNGLTLRALIAQQSRKPTRLWLDVKNAERSSLAFLDDYLNSVFPPDERGSVLIEMSLAGVKDGALKVLLGKVRSDGYGLSFYLPTEEAIQCSAAGETPECRDVAHRIANVVKELPYSSLSFDAKGKRFALRIARPEGMELNTWDTRVEKASDIDRDLLHKTGMYLIPYKSRFDY